MPKSDNLLAQLIQLDAAQWSQPSNSLALTIHDLEARYQQITGQPCPPWPRRGRADYAEEATPAGMQLTIPGCDHTPKPGSAAPFQLSMF